ncbi:unnamed protein product, partial [Gongylonema pulchrum]|uniref:EGF-like domain-containing protein n=1 Tax=Gongylonema pulchrum TaxID=637853 RepID=A0A183EZ50_9BILA
MCQKQKECSFNPDSATFLCGCPFGYSRTSAGVCIPLLAPPFNGDCADLQRRYHLAGSGLYSLQDWSCSKPENCTFPAYCEMKLLGGGW